MPFVGLSRAVCGVFFALLLTLVAYSGSAAPSNSVSDFTTQTGAFLKKHVAANGSVNYAAIQKAPTELKALVKQIESFDAKAATAAERKAFYLNAYNVLVISSVVERYPTPSVMKLPGFFDTKRHKVAGESMTLNGLEANKLRKPFGDARIHFALVCAAKGCPRLVAEPYRADGLDEQLDAQTRRVLRDPQFLRRDDAAGKVQLSEIFKWYDGDFKAGGKTVLAYINQYLDKPIPASYKIDYYTYDWGLNDQR
ncbi:DUF547 domain-containing protein [Hymenobacter koreensis]|uniref:DUF547 domain-containing protein n=1 Tax=Hymenobacter koreensis TaxID=1084523 RepID=A0ABP8JAC8_9BACT